MEKVCNSFLPEWKWNDALNSDFVVNGALTGVSVSHAVGTDAHFV